MGFATIAAIYHYPVKGLSPQRLESVALTAGETLPFDRAYAIENGPGAFDPSAPRHLPKVAFLCLMRDERLATLETKFESETSTLTLARDGQTLVTGDLGARDGRGLIEAFLSLDMSERLRGAPKIVSAPSHSFSDVKEKCVHIINLASVRALEQSMGRAIDPLRFRPNIIIDGLEAWAELDFVGRDLALGAAHAHVFKRTVRCAATNVDPKTAARDCDVPDALWRTLGHRDFGIYATVTKSGVIAQGDRLSGAAE